MHLRWLGVRGYVFIFDFQIFIDLALGYFKQLPFFVFSLSLADEEFLVFQTFILFFFSVLDHVISQNFNLLAEIILDFVDAPFQVDILTLLFIIIHVLRDLLSFYIIFIILGIGLESSNMAIRLIIIIWKSMISLILFTCWLFILLLFICINFGIFLGLLWSEFPYRLAPTSTAVTFNLRVLFILYVDLWELVHAKVPILTNSTITQSSFVIFMILHVLIILRLIAFSWTLYCFQRRLLYWWLSPILLITNTVLFVQLGLAWLAINPLLKWIYSFLELHWIYLAFRWMMIHLSTVLRGKW